MNKIYCLLLVVVLSCNLAIAKNAEYTIGITVNNIPQGQQSLYVPLDIDTMIFDLDKVALDDLAAQNILAVTATSMDKIGPGIGILQLDEKGLPSSINLKVYLKPIVSSGETTISLGKVADEPVLPAKGAKIKNDVKVSVLSSQEIEVTGTDYKGKKKLVLNENAIMIHVERDTQKSDTIFIPLVFDKNIIDVDESFGHAVVGPGIAAKTFGSGSLHGGGAGVEVVLSEAADKDFDVNVDLLARKEGSVKIIAAYPQEGHTPLIAGPVVEINPSTISIAK